MINDRLEKWYRYLNAEDANDIAMKEILLENGFPLGFLMKQWKKQQEFLISFQMRKLKNEKIFGNILTFTIDPVDAKDFDDAISIQSFEKWQL